MRAVLKSVYQEKPMKDRVFYALAVLTLAVLTFAKVGEVRQSPPEPNCTLDPELCNKGK